MAAVPRAADEKRNEGSVLLARGLYRAAAQSFEDWLEIVEPSGEPDLILPALNALATVAQRRHDQEAALGWLGRAQPYLTDRRASPVHVAKVHINRLVSLGSLGRAGEALQESETALEAARRSGIAHLTGLVFLNLSALRAQTGDWVRMRHDARAALDHLDVHDRQVVLAARLNLGVAHLEMGALRLAERDLLAALGDGPGGGTWRAYVHTELARLSRLRGDTDRAFDKGARALDLLLQDVGVVDKQEVARISELFGDLFADAGDRALALKYLNRSAAYYSQLGQTAGWQRVTARIAQVLPLRGQAVRGQLREVIQPLDLLTAVLDLTDDIEVIDPFLRGHAERVAQLAGVIGRAAGLGDSQLRSLLLAARLHDVGTVAIEADVLRKPGPLSPNEWERIRLHPIIAAEMLAPYDLDRAGLEAIRYHHEHWDGSGYPHGLKGDAIPFLARVLAVADVYDALTSDRAWRPAHTHRGALRLLQGMAGRELDPDVVALFLKLHHVPSTGGEWR